MTSFSPSKAAKNCLPHQVNDNDYGPALWGFVGLWMCGDFCGFLVLKSGKLCKDLVRLDWEMLEIANMKIREQSFYKKLLL